VLVQGNTFLGNSMGIGLSGGKRDRQIHDPRKHVPIQRPGHSSRRGPERRREIDDRFNRFLSNTRGLELDSTRAVVINNLFANSKEMTIRSRKGVNTIAFNTIAKGGAGGLDLVGIGSSFGDKSLVATTSSSRTPATAFRLTPPATRSGWAETIGSATPRARFTGSITISEEPGRGAQIQNGSYALAAGSPLINMAIAAFTTDHDITGAKRTKPTSAPTNTNNAGDARLNFRIMGRKSGDSRSDKRASRGDS